ncbi:nucleotidyltransferase domain-containing protein [Clostridium sp. MB40-C1]|uniref:type VII toxin-antitoxin system MntA family adenylyltransferase antitoxin n=1 Tax=Clostridium sp. MB40-C1 TaxID=3070996 RepID=UPI0035A6020C
MGLTDFEIKKIVDFLINKINPYLMYLFGSSVKGNFREDSDIDIAFLSHEEYSDYEIFMIAQELADIMKREIDLVNLKKSSTVFKAQIVGTGKTIYCNDENKRMYFEMYAFKDYALLNEERAEILKGIKKRGSVYGE